MDNKEFKLTEDLRRVMIDNGIVAANFVFVWIEKVGGANVGTIKLSLVNPAPKIIEIVDGGVSDLLNHVGKNLGEIDINHYKKHKNG